MTGQHAAVDDFRVLFVCTANKCRSPMAEYLLRDAVTRAWGPVAAEWSISSVGTHVRGRSMDPNALQVLQERGIDGSGFQARRLAPALAADADLILTATREHRGLVAQQAPSALRRMFTVNQFAYLLSAVPPIVAADPVQAGLELIDQASAARSQMPGRTDKDDLPDPVTQPIGKFRDCARTLDEDIAGIIRAIDPRNF